MNTESSMWSRLAHSPHSRVGTLLVGGAGTVWALLCWRLAADGHAPSRVLLPIPREQYYGYQAVFVIPLLLLSFTLAARAAHAMAWKLGGSGRLAGTANVLGVALSLPLLCVLLVPDFVVYQGQGFAALGRLIRITAPLSFVLTVVLASFAARGAHGIGAWRSVLVGFVFVGVQACSGGAFLR